MMMQLGSSPNRQAAILLALALLIPLAAYFARPSAPKSTFPLLSEDGLKNVLYGKEILVVGGTDGVGGALTHALVKRGAAVTVTGSSPEIARKLPRGSVDFIKSNVSTMRGAQELAGHLLRGRKFDTVVFCGGFVPRPLIFGAGEGGGEEDLATSYLSRFIILNELVRNHALTGRKRVYVLAYPGDDPMLSVFEDMKFDWSDYKEIPRHLNTVLFNDAMIKEAARRFPDIRVYGVNPGFLSHGAATDIHAARHGIVTRTMESLAGLVIKSPERYAEKTLIQIIASPELHMYNGEYISDTLELLPPKRWFSKEQNRVSVWENSEKLVYQALG